MFRKHPAHYVQFSLGNTLSIMFCLESTLPTILCLGSTLLTIFCNVFEALCSLCSFMFRKHPGYYAMLCFGSTLLNMFSSPCSLCSPMFRKHPAHYVLLCLGSTLLKGGNAAQLMSLLSGESDMTSLLTLLPQLIESGNYKVILESLATTR